MHVFSEQNVCGLFIYQVNQRPDLKPDQVTINHFLWIPVWLMVVR